MQYLKRTVPRTVPQTANDKTDTINSCCNPDFRPMIGTPVGGRPTKAYVLPLSESLAEELRDGGISVTTLCPGNTATGMPTRAAAQNARVAATRPKP